MVRLKGINEHDHCRNCSRAGEVRLAVLLEPTPGAASTHSKRELQTPVLEHEQRIHAALLQPTASSAATPRSSFRMMFVCWSDYMDNRVSPPRSHARAGLAIPASTGAAGPLTFAERAQLEAVPSCAGLRAPSFEHARASLQRTDGKTTYAA